MVTFVAFTFLLLMLYLGGAAAIIRYLPRVRNRAAFLVAVFSAYVFSIAFDNVWGPVLGGLPPSLVPVVAGIAYGLGFYSVARRLATSPNPARAAFFVIGALGVLAGFVGHKHNFFVGGSLLLLPLVLPFGFPAESRRASLAP
jgi:hypothetical protein